MELTETISSFYLRQLAEFRWIDLHLENSKRNISLILLLLLMMMMMMMMMIMTFVEFNNCVECQILEIYQKNILR